MQHRIRIYGIVQGIGFRPFVKRLADACGIFGSVCNRGSYVEIEAGGTDEAVQAFERRVTAEAPKASRIIRTEICSVKEVKTNGSFSILESVPETGTMFVSPDLAICPDCERELFDPSDRRYLHPFINCTNCGPRLTILEELPYDRERTSMRHFPMCPDCTREYTHPETRRYHAQPICCKEDGPRLWVIETDGDRENGWERPSGLNAETDAQALSRTRQVIREGGIAAIKGIGGFHLACDASNEEAVRRLRALKHRPGKPFAVMMKNLETVRRECESGVEEEQLLSGTERPIVLLRRRGSSKFHTTTSRICSTKFDTEVSLLAASVAPDNPSVGVMLPYAPVQLLLFDHRDGLPFPDLLVMTSGNPGGAPIARTTEEAVRDLSPMCDLILTNDREIRLRADDSVVQLADGELSMIRRSRGYAPLPIAGADSGRMLLAVGGELKNTFVLAKDGLCYPSPYIGDLADRRSGEALDTAVKRMERLLEIRPSAVAADLHPRYRSSRYAADYAEAHRIPLIYVQHHFAHIRSCTAENGRRDETVIGVSFDGTGYGTDGTIWGGEFLVASPDHFVRAGSLAPFWQAGGDAASKEGWRIAGSLLRDACGAEAAEVVQTLGLCSESEFRVLSVMLEQRLNTVESTSAGRLFDAAAAILGIRRASTFEGEASMALQFAAERACDSLCEMSRPVLRGMCEADGRRQTAGGGFSNRSFVIETAPMIREMAERAAGGSDVEALAYGFHRWLAEAVKAGCCRLRAEHGIGTAALSGGVFQNQLLLHLCREALEQQGFEVLVHHQIPANDGGIALGQADAASHFLKKADRKDENTV